MLIGVKQSLEVKSEFKPMIYKDCLINIILIQKRVKRNLKELKSKEYWHHPPPALNKIYDPMSNSGMSASNY